MRYRAEDIERALTGSESNQMDASMRSQLETMINDCILSDFDRLLQLLYRLDIDESKLRGLLHDMPGKDAASIITDLIIERQLQKVKSRQQFSRRDDNINEEDRW